MSSNLELKTVEKNCLYFKQYQYSAKFQIPEASVLRGLDSASIDDAIDNRNRWRRNHYTSYGAYSRSQQISEEQTAHLKIVCSLLEQHRDEIKFTVSYDYGYVYTNNVDLLYELKLLPCLRSFKATEVISSGQPDTIRRLNPEWTHRTYLKSKTVTAQQRQNLVAFLQSRENIRLSGSLDYWTRESDRQGWSLWIQDYYFFDHNNDGELLLLNMVMPRITGRTLQIVAK